jgi:hypothetical protein
LACSSRNVLLLLWMLASQNESCDDGRASICVDAHTHRCGLPAVRTGEQPRSDECRDNARSVLWVAMSTGPREGVGAMKRKSMCGHRVVAGPWVGHGWSSVSWCFAVRLQLLLAVCCLHRREPKRRRVAGRALSVLGGRARVDAETDPQELRGTRPPHGLLAPAQQALQDTNAGQQ